jgi:hypothetical protein
MMAAAVVSAGIMGRIGPETDVVVAISGIL